MKFLAFLLLIFSNIEEKNECITIYPNPVIDELIEISAKLKNIHSLKCNFTTLDEPGSHEFMYQDGNVFISMLIPIQEMQQPVSSSQTKNLLELISYKLQKSHQKIEENPITVSIYNYYLYQGKESGRDIYIRKDRSIEIEESWKRYDGMLPVRGDPRINLGYVGNVFFYLGSKYRIHISEFLKKEGPFYLSKKKDFTILWHEIDFDEYLPEKERYGAKLSLEIWFDNKRRIHRIRQGEFWSRSLGLGTVKNIVGEECSCDYPENVIFDFWYQDYKEFENDIYLPLRVIVDLFVPDNDDVRHKELLINSNKKYDVNYLVKRSTFNKKIIKNKFIYIIEESSIKINEPIPVETFIAPEPTKNSEGSFGETNLLYFKKLKPLSFIFICIFLTFLTMFITRKYWGWGL